MVDDGISGNKAERVKSGVSHSSLSYGPDKRQNIDLYQLPKVKNPPLVIFVHGGGWRRLAVKLLPPGHKLAHGYSPALPRYRSRRELPL